MQGEIKFSVDGSLMKNLQENERWRMAHRAAKVLFEDIVLIARSEKTTSDLSPLTRRVMRPMMPRFIRGEEATFTGHVSQGELFDTVGLMLNVEIQFLGGGRRALEIWFGESGEILHAAT